jgi:hypothetical protein
MKYFILTIFFSKIIQVMNGRIFLLLVVLITFLFMFLHLFNTPSKSSISIEIYQQYISKTRRPQKPKEPIIFSKFGYLNQSRKVKLF